MDVNLQNQQTRCFHDLPHKRSASDFCRLHPYHVCHLHLLMQCSGILCLYCSQLLASASKIFEQILGYTPYHSTSSCKSTCTPDLAIGDVKDTLGYVLSGRHIWVPAELLSHLENGSGPLILLRGSGAHLTCLLGCQSLPAYSNTCYTCVSPILRDPNQCALPDNMVASVLGLSLQ